MFKEYFNDLLLIDPHLINVYTDWFFGRISETPYSVMARYWDL